MAKCYWPLSCTAKPAWLGMGAGVTFVGVNYICSCHLNNRSKATKRKYSIIRGDVLSDVDILKRHLCIYMESRLVSSDACPLDVSGRSAETVVTCSNLDLEDGHSVSIA